MTSSVNSIDRQYINTLPYLYLGCTGVYVKILQVLLEYYGHISVRITGEYDAVTEAAVKNYQKDFDLKISGKCDKELWYHLLITRK